MSIDSENTMRRLKDQLPVLNSIRCRIGLHQWTVWSNPFQNGNDVFIQRQYRHCVCCNLHKEKIR